MKYLIFRSDRIGDFLITAPLIQSIKRNDNNHSIEIVCSSKNANYINNLNFVDKIYILKKIILYLSLIYFETQKYLL